MYESVWGDADVRSTKCHTARGNQSIELRTPKCPFLGYTEGIPAQLASSHSLYTQLCVKMIWPEELLERRIKYDC